MADESLDFRIEVWSADGKLGQRLGRFEGHLMGVGKGA
jgi:hypothetical protein